MVVITKNEEQNIGDCLASVAWADEIVVVDAESHDQTVPLVRRYTDRVFIRPWPGFGPQKNFAIDQATSAWILVLDADERVEPALRQEIESILGQDPQATAGYVIPRKNFYYGAWIRGAGCFPDLQTRLFRRGKGRYNNIPVHEHLVIDGPVGRLDAPLTHFTERRIEDHFRKFDAYTTLAAEDKARRGVRPRPWTLICGPPATCFKAYVLKRGFRDGVRGLIVSVFAGFYTFIKYFKLWERWIVGSSPGHADRA